MSLFWTANLTPGADLSSYFAATTGVTHKSVLILILSWSLSHFNLPILYLDPKMLLTRSLPFLKLYSSFL